MNNYLEGWFSLKWFYPSQILSYEWGNENILYLILILPVFLIARKLIRNKIIGITCHNSIKLAKDAIKDKADYVAFGAFNFSKTNLWHVFCFMNT